MIKTVFLDLGRVITRPPSSDNWQTLVREIGLSEETFIRRLYDMRYEYDKGTMTTEDFWTHVVNDNGGPPLEAEKIQRLVEADTRCWADFDMRMIEWSDSLRAAGYRTGILSNMPLPYVRFIRREVSWFDRFSHHVLSAELKQMKPEPEIYRTALDSCGTPPEEVLFIDDLPENIEAAREAGMRGIIFTGIEDLHEIVTSEYGLPPIF